MDFETRIRGGGGEINELPNGRPNIENQALGVYI